jgi:hypothetical protein
LTQYFREAIPPSELSLLQARIVISHFGPGSIASEGYYTKFKGRCLLKHPTVMNIFECFMRADQRCDLIVEKSLFLDNVAADTRIDQSLDAVSIPELGRTYTLV